MTLLRVASCWLLLLLLLTVGSVTWAANDNSKCELATTVAYEGPTILNKTMKDPDECCNLCTQTHGCVAFTHRTAWVGREGVVATCNLKSAIEKTRNYTGIMDIHVISGKVSGTSVTNTTTTTPAPSKTSNATAPQNDANGLTLDLVDPADSAISTAFGGSVNTTVSNATPPSTTMNTTTPEATATVLPATATVLPATTITPTTTNTTTTINTTTTTTSSNNSVKRKPSHRKHRKPARKKPAKKKKSQPNSTKTVTLTPKDMDNRPLQQNKTTQSS